jgi:hypothetical protein
MTNAVTPAHTATQGHRYVIHFPEHDARVGDPNYADFNAYHRKTRKAARCYVGERVGFGDCQDEDGVPCPPPIGRGEQPGLELHHAHIEFSLQNGISLTALEVDYPGVSDPDQVGAWVESGANFRWYCVTEGSPVLMADGTTRPIEYVVPGDYVIGKDGQAYPVTASSRKRYSGEVIVFGDASFTPGHRLMTGNGWQCAGEIAYQVRMFGPEVVALRGEQRQVRTGVVRPVSVAMMYSFLRQQWTAYPLFHDDDMLHAQSGAVPDPDVAFRGDVRRAVADIPLRQFVEGLQPAVVGAEAPLPGAGAPVRGAVECGRAGFALPEMTWVTAMPRRTAAFTGWVHDLSVAHSHSFVAGGVVTHNCTYHHRSQAGAHSAAHSDFEGSFYVLGLITKAGESDLSRAFGV